MLSVRDLRVTYVGADHVTHMALDGLDLEVGAGEVVTVLGPSGCGKSTLLRVVAGLVEPDGGRIVLDGDDLAGVAVHRRGIGLMFQDYALFPHRDVGQNVAFGLRMQGMGAAARDDRVAELLAMVGLPDAAPRPVSTLSGGERQRVALARALAPRPRLLLLDEPLGALDRTLRDRLVIELGELFADLALTVVYVTHDQAEALALGDRVAIMNRGRIVQIGAPADVWAQPVDRFAAAFLGFENLLDVDVVATVARTPWGPVAAPDVADGPATVLVRPEAVTVHPWPPAPLAAARSDGDGAAPSDGEAPGVDLQRAEVVEVAFVAGRWRLVVDVGGTRLVTEVDGADAPVHGPVGVAIDPRGTVVLGR